MDPVEEPDFYLEAARREALQIRYVVDTHVHADHVSTGRALAAIAGAEYVLHESVPGRFPFRGVADGDVLELGNVQARVLHTPGHTPEHVSLVVTDCRRGLDPWFLMSGHTLMVGDVGRTELASSLDEGAKALFATIQRLKSLPDYVEVLPGAHAGSICGRGLSGKTWSTIGFERRFNPGLLVETEAEFLQFMARDVPPRPPEAERTRMINLGVMASTP